MKFDRYSTRRKLVSKTFYSRFFNKTKTKKQRASAGTATPEDMQESGINISRSLSIIFAIHILAIGMIFIHKQYLSGRTPTPETTSTAESSMPAVTPAVRNNDLPTLSDGDKRYVVSTGDNYARIAAKFDVDESELRQTNVGSDIRSGMVLRIPQGKRIVAEEAPEVAAIRNQSPINESERGLVEIVPAEISPAARVIRPVTREQIANAPKAKLAPSGRTHVIKSGDNLWRISNTYKVSQKDVMSLNNISDPTKLKIGQVIKLP